MNVSMNGPQGPTFPFPTWILVYESRLFEDGLPEGIPSIPIDSQAGEPCLMIFASRADAQEFADRTAATWLRPMCVNDIILFIAIVNCLKKAGANHVVLLKPRERGPSCYRCDPDELIARLAAANRSGQ
ncbi:MAG TPA: hypothetical protein VHR66_25310 [Gemmataceae bacterium]|jgi:hypothetical protein|nr:hypothetical protein [Gemmataceae bacterium]